MKMILPKLSIQVEKWRYNKDYHLYVSNRGNFKISRKLDAETFVDPKNGYLRVKTCKGIKAAHRIVASTWLKASIEGYTIDHLDSNRRNNCVSNLEIITREENQRRAVDKTMSPSQSMKELLKVRRIVYTKKRQSIDIQDANQIIAIIRKVNPEACADRILARVYNSITQGVPYYGANWSQGPYRQ